MAVFEPSPGLRAKNFLISSAPGEALPLRVKNSGIERCCSPCPASFAPVQVGLETGKPSPEDIGRAPRRRKSECQRGVVCGGNKNGRAGRSPARGLGKTQG